MQPTDTEVDGCEGAKPVVRKPYVLNGRCRLAGMLPVPPACSPRPARLGSGRPLCTKPPPCPRVPARSCPRARSWEGKGRGTGGAELPPWLPGAVAQSPGCAGPGRWAAWLGAARCLTACGCYAELEHEASLPEKKSQTLSKDLIDYVQHMIRNHGENYKVGLWGVAGWGERRAPSTPRIAQEPVRAAAPQPGRCFLACSPVPR